MNIKQQCKKKITYTTASDAWNDALYQSVKHNTLMVCYKCPLGNHYHLSSKHHVGDGSQFPPDLREMFCVFGEEYIGRRSFIQKLRALIVWKPHFGKVSMKPTRADLHDKWLDEAMEETDKLLDTKEDIQLFWKQLEQ